MYEYTKSLMLITATLAALSSPSAHYIVLLLLLLALLLSPSPLHHVL